MDTAKRYVAVFFMLNMQALCVEHTCASGMSSRVYSTLRYMYPDILVMIAYVYILHPAP